MSSSDGLLYVLPFLTDLEEDRVFPEFFKMVGNHYFMYRIAESVGGHPFIPFPSYAAIELEELSLINEGSVYPKESNEFLQVFSEAISPLDSIKRKAQLVSRGESSFSNKQNIHRTIGQINRFLINANRSKIDRIPVLSIPFKKEYSLTRLHVSKMLNNQKWIRQLISFFQYITENKVKGCPGLKIDSFLFNEEGEIEKFLMYNMLERSNASDTEILLHNLEVFAALIEDFSGELYGSGYREDQHNSDFNLLMIALNNNEYAFDDFNEIEAFLESQGKRGKSQEKIAVFLDTANIFTGLHTYDIHFSSLLSKIFGEKKNITEQYAALFYPVYESASKTSYEKARRDEFKASLEAQGFQVLVAANGRDKAKVIEGGREMDVDDLMLIAKMKERMDKFKKVLVLTGDKHFLPIMKEYEENGIKVNVVSIHEDDTAQEIKTHFKDRHHLITDYWESILI
ncbi:NYN domain-containing protein [Mesobacillus sp. LC4]